MKSYQELNLIQSVYQNWSKIWHVLVESMSQQSKTQSSYVY